MAKILTNDELVTPNQAVKFLGWSASYIRGLYHAGLIDGFTSSDGPKAHIQLYKDSVLKYRQQRTNAPTIKERLGTAA